MQELLREHYEQSTSVRQFVEALVALVQPLSMQQPIQPLILQMTDVKGQMHPIYRPIGRHHLPEFKGTTDPVVALEWLEAMEKVIAMSIMSNQEKVKYVAYLLKGDAKVWSRLMGTTCFVESMSWVDFK